MDKNNVMELDTGDNKGGEYKVENIKNSALYSTELESGYHPLELYYLIFWKEYLEEKNTGELALVV